jgi:hypothetical protein
MQLEEKKVMLCKTEQIFFLKEYERKILRFVKCKVCIQYG